MGSNPIRATDVSGTRRGKEVVYGSVDTHIARIVNDAVRHSLERRRS